MRLRASGETRDDCERRAFSVDFLESSSNFRKSRSTQLSCGLVKEGTSSASFHDQERDVTGVLYVCVYVNS